MPRCPVCRKQFLTAEAVSQHGRALHEQMKCPYCKKVSDPRGIQAHIAAKHAAVQVQAQPVAEAPSWSDLQFAVLQVEAPKLQREVSSAPVSEARFAALELPGVPTPPVPPRARRQPQPREPRQSFSMPAAQPLRSEGLALKAPWAYAHRKELKRRGFTWDGFYWRAPDQRTLYLAIQDLAERPPPPEWSVTIHGDAGWKDGLGRWAWFCRSSMPPLVLEDVGEGPCADCNVAETRALLSGIIQATSVWVPPEDIPGIIYLRSDSLNALDAVYAARQDRSSRLYKILPPNITLNIRHVPGHSRDGTSASWVNARVDAASNLRSKR